MAALGSQPNSVRGLAKWDFFFFLQEFSETGAY